MISTLIIRMLSCVCSVRLARHGDTDCESGTTALRPLPTCRGWDVVLVGTWWRRLSLRAVWLVVRSLRGWGRAGLRGEICAARHLGCTRLHASVRIAQSGAAVARGGLCAGGRR